MRCRACAIQEDACAGGLITTTQTGPTTGGWSCPARMRPVQKKHRGEASTLATVCAARPRVPHMRCGISPPSGVLPDTRARPAGGERTRVCDRRRPRAAAAASPVLNTDPLAAECIFRDRRVCGAEWSGCMSRWPACRTRIVASGHRNVVWCCGTAHMPGRPAFDTAVYTQAPASGSAYGWFDQASRTTR